MIEGNGKGQGGGGAGQGQRGMAGGRGRAAGQGQGAGGWEARQGKPLSPCGNRAQGPENDMLRGVTALRQGRANAMDMRGLAFPHARDSHSCDFTS